MCFNIENIIQFTFKQDWVDSVKSWVILAGSVSESSESIRWVSESSESIRWIIELSESI